MAKSYERIFKDKTILRGMIFLHYQNPKKWTFSALGRMYSVDHTTIIHHWQKFRKGDYLFEFTKSEYFDIPPLPQRIKSTIPFQETDDEWYIDYNGERIRREKSYKQIHTEAQERRKNLTIAKVQFPTNFKGRSLF